MIIIITGLATNSFAGSKHQFDSKGYDKIAKRNIGMILTGNVDADKMLSEMEKLLKFGVAGCEEHMGEPETPAEELKIMKHTIENVNKMTSLALDEIEEQWHEGEFLKAKGIDIGKYDHFAEVMCHYDAVVHPATVIICLRQYKKTNNEDFLEQAKNELAEVREHLKHLE
jgi:hypothetical protein